MRGESAEVERDSLSEKEGPTMVGGQTKNPLGFPPAAGPDRIGDMNPYLTGGSLEGKRIIQILSAFNCRFLGPNTR